MILRDGFWENDEYFDKTFKNPSPKRGHLPSTRDFLQKQIDFRDMPVFSREISQKIYFG
jgi:hypothetical protein